MLCARPTQSRAVCPQRAAVRPVVANRPQLTVHAAAAEPQIAADPVVVAEDSFAEPEQARAVLRFQRGSASKIRRVLDCIRGRTYEDALKILTYLPYRATEPILKVLLSAGANAKENLGMRKSSLYVSECYCDEGPTMKRFRPRAQGRAFRIMKRTSHITIKVAEAK
eukprot:jgi/Ulvmu1/1288/UM011_0012.1